MKKILVCGGSGFLGTNLLMSLREQNYSIRATYYKSKPSVHHQNIEWIKADLTNSKDVKRAIEGVDVIIQLAATTSGAKDIVSMPYIHVTDNAVMNSLILREAFEKQIEHFIFPSCTVMYQSSDIPVLETDFKETDEPNKKYFGAAWTKVYIEKMCEFYSRLPKNKTKFTVFRHSNIYGPYDKFDLEKSHVFGATVTKIMSNKDGKIIVWGSGKEKRDFLYVDDLVEFMLSALQSQKESFSLVNVGSGNLVSINELVETAVRVSGKDVSIENDLSKPTIETSLCLDCKKAKDLFNWEPRTSLSEGLTRTFQWYSENIQ